MKGDTTMRVSFKENKLTIVTDISKELAAKNPRMVLKDEKGNEVYTVAKAADSTRPSICGYGLQYNTVVDGNVAVEMFVPDGITLEQVKKDLGSSLLAAETNIPKIAAEIAAHTAAVDALFAEAE